MNLLSIVILVREGPFLELPFLAIWDFLAFLLFKEFLDFLSVLTYFSKEFRGSEETENPYFLGSSPLGGRFGYF